MADKPNYTECESLAAELCERFLSGDIDRVELIYHHFKSAGSQELVNTVYLPIDLSAMTEVPTDNRQPDYLIEPSEEILLAKLIPEVLKLKVYTTLFRLQRIRTCHTKHGHADSHGQCQQLDTGPHRRVQQRTSAGHYQRTVGHHGRHHGLMRRAPRLLKKTGHTKRISSVCPVIFPDSAIALTCVSYPCIPDLKNTFGRLFTTV